MISRHLVRLVLASALLPLAVAAQESRALMNALVRKGILSDAEAAAIVAEVKGEPPEGTTARSLSPYLQKLALTGRVQVQFANLTTHIEGASRQPAATDHFFLRRVLFGARAEFTDRWSAAIVYDSALSSFDAAMISWKAADWLVIDAGLRKVPFLIDETTTSADVRAIERSPLTLYFVEAVNGRRLGAGSYHVGVYAGGRLPWGFYYNGAITNPERLESGALSSIGHQGNNRQAFWADFGVARKLAGFDYRLGASGGYLPDQGGRNIGFGDSLIVAGAYAEVRRGGFLLRSEYAWSQNEHGVSPTRDANSAGFYLMPCYRIGKLEGVVRYSLLDSDGRGVDLADGVRSAPSSGALNRMSEWFIGGNYYFHENDTKLQLGYIRAEARDALTGVPAWATADGVRSQLQINF